MSLDLTVPAQNLTGFLKARTSLDGRDSYTWFTGTTHAFIPGEGARPLFGFEGYNVSRAVEAEGGYDLLTREAVFYTDLRSGDVIETLRNPYTDTDVDVVHIWNDPVNMAFREQSPRGPFLVPTSGIGDELFFNVDVFLAYPSPLPRAQFPDESQSDTYQAAELFQFFCKASEILDESVIDASCNVSWTRLGPWLPWMKMGDRDGMLVYHGRGAKIAGYDALPEHIRAKVEADGPTFKTAPTEFTQPNETSWTYYRKLHEQSASNQS